MSGHGRRRLVVRALVALAVVAGVAVVAAPDGDDLAVSLERSVILDGSGPTSAPATVPSADAEGDGDGAPTKGSSAPGTQPGAPTTSQPGAATTIPAVDRPTTTVTVLDQRDRRVARTIEVNGAPTPVSVAAGVPAGAYTYTALVTATGQRVRLTLGGERVGEFTVSGERELAVPVHVRGEDDPLGVTAADDGVDGATITVTRLALTPSTPVGTTRGAVILDAHGRPVVPRGVNRTGLNQQTEPVNMTRADFRAMRDRGVTIVRLKLGEHLWVAGHCAHDPAYPAAVDRAVTAITDLGMEAMLDLAWTTAGDPCGEPGLKPMPDLDSIVFWRQVATRYRDDPQVTYGIFNEPGNVTRDMWRDGGEIEEDTGLLSSRTWQAVGMQRLYDTVRATGARSIVYVSGIGYSADLRPALSHPLDGYGLVYGSHIYCHGCDTLPPIVERGVEPVVGRFPVVVSEFGTTDPSPVFNQRVIDWAEDRGLGWQAFMWADTDHGAYGLLESWDTYQPSAAGRPVLATLARLR